MYSEIKTPTLLKANSMPCQFTADFSKTKNALNYIKKIIGMHDIDELFNYEKFHKIIIIFTNNSLEETKQWKTRTTNHLKGFNIWTLSSKNDSTFKNLASIQEGLLSIKYKNKLPDVIIMCGHDKRANDIITLIERFETQIKFHPSINKSPLFEVFFDEADKQLSIISKFFRSNIIRKEEGIPGSLVSIMFISATLYDNFWKMLKNEGINELDFSWLTEVMENVANDKGFNSFDEYFEELLNNYRKISDHIQIIDDNPTLNPVEYVKKCFDKILTNYNKLNNNEPFIVFAPAKNTIKSHEEMSNFFISKNCACLIHNGRYKEFRFPNKQHNITIEDFRKKYNIEGELYEVLIKFRKEFPNCNLAITGHNTIERGITFNTIGFQFTHAIFSTYHSQHLETLLQMFGRNDGDNKYVGIFNIISTKKMFKLVENAVKRLTNIIYTKPDTISYEDFEDIEDLDYNCKTVPIVIDNITEEEFKIFEKNGSRYNREKIINFLKIKGCNWINENEYKETSDSLLLISSPKNELTEKAKKTTKTAYEKLVLSGIDNSAKNKKNVIGLNFKNNSQQIEKKSWCIFIDIILKNRVIIYRWDGSKKI
jgi:hypothetical protein